MAKMAHLLFSLHNLASSQFSRHDLLRDVVEPLPSFKINWANGSQNLQHCLASF